MKDLLYLIEKFSDKTYSDVPLCVYSIEEKLKNDTISFLNSSALYQEKEKFINELLIVLKNRYNNLKEINSPRYVDFNKQLSFFINREIMYIFTRDLFSCHCKIFWSDYFKKNPEKLIEMSVFFNGSLFNSGMFSFKEKKNIFKKIKNSSLDLNINDIDNIIDSDFSRKLVTKFSAPILFKKLNKDSIMKMLNTLASINSPPETGNEETNTNGYYLEYSKHLIDYNKTLDSTSVLIQYLISSPNIYYFKNNHLSLFFKVNIDNKKIICYIDNKVNINYDAFYYLNKIFKKDIHFYNCDLELTDKEYTPKNIKKIRVNFLVNKFKYNIEKIIKIIKIIKEEDQYSVNNSIIQNLARKEDLTIINYLTGYYESYKCSYNFNYLKLFSKHPEIEFQIYEKINEFLEENEYFFTSNKTEMTKEGVEIFKINYLF